MQSQSTHDSTSPAAGQPQGGPGLAEMAQRDLDAALQLLADRAQYITGASGVAIALRRDGRNDMLCRASAGSNAPELGALLSTEFGLSGESVRTRQALRCDDAERDARVNREVCRQLGIASVVVMPVVNDDEVLGVFELFSGKANAFGTRDVSAVQRLSEMVETAVRLAQATQNLTARLKTSEISAAGAEAAEVLEEQIEEQSDEQILEGEVLADVILEEPVLEEAVLEKPELLVEAAAAPEALKAEIPSTSASAEQALSEEARAGEASSILEHTAAAAPEPPKAVVPENATASPQVAAAADPGPVAAPETEPKKKLFWSAALNPAADAAKQEDADQSHVPPVLRSLRKCEACGFPVSAGRVLCVECEEKKWRGHLKVPKVVAPLPMAMPPSPVAAAAGRKPEPRAFAGAASAPILSTPGPSAAVVSSGAVAAGLKKESKVADASNVPLRTPVARVAPPEFVLSAGLEPSQSWLSANKYILGVLLFVAAVAAVFLLR